MIVEADVKYHCSNNPEMDYKKRIMLGISSAATDAQLRGELTLEALRQIDAYMGATTAKEDFIELTNIHRTLMEHEKREG